MISFSVHHRVSFVIATGLLGATTEPWVGGLLSALIAGLFALGGITLQGRIARRRGVSVEAAALTALAEQVARLQQENDFLAHQLATLQPPA